MIGQIKINAVKPRVQYVGDGTRCQFFFPFPIFLESNLEVYLGSVQQTSGFTVSGVGETDGGSVTFSTPPASGTLVTLRRYLLLQRLSDFQDSGQFRARVLNDELDYLTATVQQLDAEATRTIRLNPTDGESSLTLPDAAKRAGQMIVFDENGSVTTQPAAAAAASAAWETLDDIPEGTVNRHFSDVERVKLSGIGAGAEANPAPVSENEKASASETSLRSFSPKDVKDIASRFVSDGNITSVYGRTGAVVAQTGDYSAEQITDTAARVLMTAAERSKLAGVEKGAQANTVASVHGRTGTVTAQAGDYSAEQITETATRVVMTADERSKLAAIQVGSEAGGGVTSVYGRTGAVIAQAGDYTAEQISDTAIRVLMTSDERSKLAGVEKGARAYPPLVSAAEKIAATLTEIRAFSPKDIADMCAALGGRSGSDGDVNGGNAASEFTAFIDGGLASA